MTHILKCPKCKETYLHHGFVSVASRLHEDGPALLVEVPGAQQAGDGLTGGGKMSTSIVDKASGRRDSVQIAFWCEHCDFNGHLGIEQQKGQTTIGWSTHDGPLEFE